MFCSTRFKFEIEKPAETPEATGEQAQEKTEGEGEGDKEEAKEPEAAAGATTEGESGGVLPGGTGSTQAHTSVKVRAPPGGASSITF